MAWQALEGVKVLDFSWVIAAPIASEQLAQHGATVVKVESSSRLDVCRLYTPVLGNIQGVNRCGAFTAYNANKLSITIDIRKPKAMEVVKRLVAWCDIVLENFRPGAMERMGLSWEELKKINPDVIMLRVSIQGQTGPRAKNPGLGGSFQASVGFTELIGWPDREPVQIPVAFSDHIVPYYTAIIAIAALDYRDKTGRGLYYDAGQYEPGLNFLMPAALDYTVNKRVWTRDGNHHPYACPHGVYPCQGDDRWVAITVFSDEEWKAFITVIGQPGWTKSPKFSTFLARKQNETEMDKLIGEWTINYTPEEVMRKMQESGVAAGVVESNKDVFEDPQLTHRNHFIRLKHPEIGLHAYEATSYRFSKTPAELKLPAPCLGEHTAYVCTEILGMSDEEFVQLTEEGIFG